MTDPEHEALREWLQELRSLCAAIRGPVREGLAAVASGTSARDDVARAVGVGAGDTTFAIDVVAEQVVERWSRGVAARRPLSLLTEDAGWRHLGPDGRGGVHELDGFDHAGARIVLDPIDGTRNVMHDLRSAWVVASLARPGAGVPRYADLVLGLVSEIPDTRSEIVRELSAVRGSGASARIAHATTGEVLRDDAPLRVDEEARLDRGYFPYFGYHPAHRASVQALGAEVVRRLEDEHGIDPSTVLDDQYISSGGQLALLALGHYRSIVDARGTLAQGAGVRTQTAKPYDMAGAALVAQEAGCVVVHPSGAALDLPLDAETPVDFAGFHNRATADAILPLLAESLRRSPSASG
ncbi:MAG: inositol monophosphatase family protein [Planctomycetota bacterium]